MAININLFPPIVSTYMPAFLVDSEDENKNICRVYFSLSQYNNLDMIKNVQVTVRNQNTNLTSLNKSKYPSEIMLTSILEDTTKSSDDRYYIEIKKEDIQGGKFEINQYYKVQIRFTLNSPEVTEISLNTPQSIDAWLAKNFNFFSEWSTVCLVRGISAPILNISGFDMETGIISWSLANTIVLGNISYTNPEESDTLKSYQIKLYDTATNTLLTDSGLLYSNNYNEPNSFSYTFKYNFNPDTSYYFTVDFTTLNLYSEQNRFDFKVVQSSTEELNITINAVEDESNGRIGVSLKRSNSAEPLTGTIVIRRASSEDNFTTWEDVYSKNCVATTMIKEIWYDYTIKSGIWYKYCVQKINTQNERGLVKQAKTPVMIIFDDMFLVTKDRQLKIRFNPNVSSYKRTIQESRTETIGSQFPFIRRNGYTNYVQLPISGLISFEIDEDELFTSKKELFGENLSLYTKHNDTNRISAANDIVYEKLFRDKVIEFLYDNNIKLFKSATEGNFLVKIMDASLTPDTVLGRRIWSFSATAIEIAEYSVENCKEYEILEKGTGE